MAEYQSRDSGSRDGGRGGERGERSGGGAGGARPFLQTPQDLPVLRPACDSDRLEGYAHPVPLYLRARQDVPSRITAVSAKKQRELALAIKRARFMAILTPSKKEIRRAATTRAAGQIQGRRRRRSREPWPAS